MKVLQSNIFLKAVKKFNKSDKGILDEVIKDICLGRATGDQKGGDLKGIFVYKFKIRVHQYMLSYRMNGEFLELIMLGPHENYYRNLKHFLN